MDGSDLLLTRATVAGCAPRPATEVSSASCTLASQWEYVHLMRAPTLGHVFHTLSAFAVVSLGCAEPATLRRVGAGSGEDAEFKLAPPHSRVIRRARHSVSNRRPFTAKPTRPRPRLDSVASGLRPWWPPLPTHATVHAVGAGPAPAKRLQAHITSDNGDPASFYSDGCR